MLLKRSKEEGLLWPITSKHIIHKNKRLDDMARQIRQFLKDSPKSTLILFGPSGCGKTTILNYVLQDFKDRVTLLQEKDNLQKQAIQPLGEVLLETYPSLYPTNIAICFDLPYWQKTFQAKAKDVLQYGQAKLVFILNSSIYSLQHIRNCFSKDTGLVDYLQILSFRQYTSKQLKDIGKKYAQSWKKPQYLFRLDDLAELSNGDARKMVNSMWVEVEMARNKNEKSTPDQKVTLFHFLGKLLYNKRKDHYGNKPRQMTKQEHLRYDPPFYFSPLNLLKSSRLPYHTIQYLIHQSYPSFYGQVQDVAKMSDLLSVIDCCHQAKNNYEPDQDIDSIYSFLLSWGVMLYNHNCTKVQKNFHSFKKSYLSSIRKQIKLRKQLLRLLTVPTRTTEMTQCALFGQEICRLMGVNEIFRTKKYAQISKINQGDLFVQQQPFQVELNINLQQLLHKSRHLNPNRYDPKINTDLSDIESSNDDELLELIEQITSRKKASSQPIENIESQIDIQQIEDLIENSSHL